MLFSLSSTSADGRGVGKRMLGENGIGSEVDGEKHDFITINRQNFANGNFEHIWAIRHNKTQESKTAI